MNRSFSAPVRAALPPAVAPAPLGRLGGPLPATGTSTNRAYFAASRMALANIRELDRVNREDITPELEPFSPSIESGEPGDFDEEENEDVTDEMEPFDPTIESSIERATIEDHEDGSVTIHPDSGEVLDASEMAGGDVVVHVDEETP